ncbi:hypothetical protein MBLNU459_g1319t1 [Dothideomycetes sp. NU459]
MPNVQGIQPKRLAPVKPDTARNRVRENIATSTKARRDAFLIHNQDYFLPLLPQINYVSKLVQKQPPGIEMTAVPNKQITTQPVNVTAVMKPYQIQGLSFLVSMYENGMSAILGDEMGLGKTLQTLALIQHLEENHPPPSGLPRPYLVVCPLSVLDNWCAEVRKWTPQLKVLRFHGPMIERTHLKEFAQGKVDKLGRDTGRAKKTRTASKTAHPVGDSESASFDIMITTYEGFVAEQSWLKSAFVWRYCILDEGHKIKNDKSGVSHALQGLRAEHRLLLTGTPIQNNLREMWSLLHWLYPEVFNAKTSEVFEEAFDLGRGKVSTSFMDDSRRLLELIMIRRMKNSPGVNLGLPPKEEVLLYVPLTPIQRFWYTRLLTRAGGTLLDELFTGSKQKEERSLVDEAKEDNLDQLEKAVDTGDWQAESREILQQVVASEASGDRETSAYKQLMNLLMQLRKCCIHPYQVKGAAPDPYLLGDHIMHASDKFVVLSKLVDELVLNRGKKLLIFSGFTHALDYCEDLLASRFANVRYLRLDGSTARAKRNLDIRLFNQGDSEYKIMLISTRAGGLGLNLVSASDVIFLDEDWNPQVTLQAEARAHRIGQTQPVTIYKLCSQGTVEEQMMGRIRKKLYLSTKITETMRDIHSTPNVSSKRKRGRPSEASAEDDGPQLGADQLMTLIRRGATTLTHPEIDVDEMLSWDLKTTIEKCKAIDPQVAEASGQQQQDSRNSVAEQEWLAKMEKVETAVFAGVKYQKDVNAGKTKPEVLNREDRRIGKNTTVMINGFAISKESMNCADWEAVPTMAGKDPRLAEPKREKADPTPHQEHCQVCFEGGDVILCSGCPRAYHEDCMNEKYQAKSKHGLFHCSQHSCDECEKTTADAGGLMYRCRWCERGFCEDCLDWDVSVLVGSDLPEYEMLGYKSKANAWYVECHECLNAMTRDPETKSFVEIQKALIKEEYAKYLGGEDKDAKSMIKLEQDEDRKARLEQDDNRTVKLEQDSMTEATTAASSRIMTPQAPHPSSIVDLTLDDEVQATPGATNKPPTSAPPRKKQKVATKSAPENFIASADPRVLECLSACVDSDQQLKSVLQAVNDGHADDEQIRLFECYYAAVLKSLPHKRKV